MIKTIVLNGQSYNITLSEEKQEIVMNLEFKKLYESIKNLLYKLMHKYYKFKIVLYDEDDIHQEFLIILLDAIQKYDATRSDSFSNFLSMKIQSWMRMFYRDKVKLPLMKKYLSDEFEVEEHTPKTEKEKRKLAQKRRWKSAAQTAFGLMNAIYMSDYNKDTENIINSNDEDNFLNGLENDIRYSCTINLDTLFE